MASKEASVYVSSDKEVVAVATVWAAEVSPLEISRLSGISPCSSVTAVEIVDKKLWDRVSGRFSRFDKEGIVSLVCIPDRVL